MNFLFLLYLTVCMSLFINAKHDFEGIKTMLENSESCKKEACLENDGSTNTDFVNNIDHSKSEEILQENTNNNFSQKFNIDQVANKSFENNEKTSTENENVFDANYSSKTLYSRDEPLFLENIENTTKVDNNSIEVGTETSTFTPHEEIGISTTVSSNITETNNNPVTKSNTTTLPKPSSEFSWLQNTSKRNEICFCDLTASQCDINCCCDKDCSSSHWKVFTECSEISIDYDSKYCFESNIIFRNNTKHKIYINNGGLFCIVKDNSEVILNYKSKEIITNLKSFQNSFPKHLYLFSYKYQPRAKLNIREYQFGRSLWIVHNEEIKPFTIPASSVGFLCTSYLNIKYLEDLTTICSRHRPQSEIECGNSITKNVFHYLKTLKVISNPAFINESHKLDALKVCLTNSCIEVTSYICPPSSNLSKCIKIPEKATNFPKIGCLDTVPKIRYQIHHNGSEGIKLFEAFVWLRNVSQDLGEHVSHTTEVKFIWFNSSKNIFKRSGNPGYITGKPLIAGKKIYNTVNGTWDKKEAIEISYDPKDWLSVLSSEKGICSSKKRIPINFRENSHLMCSLKLTKDNFSKDKCIELQNHIFALLVGNDILNTSNNNNVNKFVATFGNSKAEDIGDWVQILIDLFPVTSSQVGFKSNYNNLMCRNIISDLFIDVAYSNIGSFLNPQAKILGVSFQFGKHKDVILNCDALGCENTTSIQNLQLSSNVHFIDLSEEAQDAFAQPHGIEAKLPHDFFYPFFSKSSTFRSRFLVIMLLIKFWFCCESL